MPGVERIKAHLIALGRIRELALFAVGFDTMLRLTVADVRAPDGRIYDTFTVRQQKIDRPATVCLTPNTRAILEALVVESGKGGGDFLFTPLRSGRRGVPISMNQYRKIIKVLAQSVGLAPALYSSHSLRRTKALLVYLKSRHDIDAVKHLLWHKNIASMSYYLGEERADALNLARTAAPTARPPCSASSSATAKSTPRSFRTAQRPGYRGLSVARST